MVQQGNRILAGLFREEERRRTNRAAKMLVFAATGAEDRNGGADDDDEEQETFADILQRVARSLDTDAAPHRGTPPPTRNIPSKVAVRAGAEPVVGPSSGGPGYAAQQPGDAHSQPFDATLPYPTSLSAGLAFGTTTTDSLLSQPFTADFDWTFAHATAGPSGTGAYDYDLGLASLGLNLDNDLGLSTYDPDTPLMTAQPVTLGSTYSSGLSTATWTDPMAAVDPATFGGNVAAVRPGMSEADAAAAYWGSTGTGQLGL